METLGEKINPVLKEISFALLEKTDVIPKYPKESLFHAAMIFQNVVLDSMWKMQEDEEMEKKYREEMATHLGKQIRKIIFEVTNIDTHQLAEEVINKYKIQ